MLVVRATTPTTGGAGMIAPDFAYHKPSTEGLAHITILREVCSTAYNAILRHAPESRQRSIALSRLEEVCMWAVKAVVVHDPASEVAV